MKFLSNEQRGILYAIASGICYGLMGYFGTHIVNSGFSVYNMMFWRYASSSLFMIFVLLKYGSIKKSPKALMRAGLMGGLIYSLGSIAYFISSRSIGTGLAMVIFFVFPAMVVIINRIIYKTAISKMYYISLSLILSGIFLLTDLSQIETGSAGIGFAMISALFYAIYIVMSKGNKLPPVTSTFMVSIGCALACLIFTFAGNTFEMPQTSEIWFDIFGLGVICTALPILLLLESMKYISSDKAAIFSVMEPIFTIIFGMILLNETVNLKQFCGVTILLLGALATLLTKKTASS